VSARVCVSAGCVQRPKSRRTCRPRCEQCLVSWWRTGRTWPCGTPAWTRTPSHLTATHGKAGPACTHRTTHHRHLHLRRRRPPFTPPRCCVPQRTRGPRQRPPPPPPPPPRSRGALADVCAPREPQLCAARAVLNAGVRAFASTAAGLTAPPANAFLRTRVLAHLPPPPTHTRARAFHTHPPAHTRMLSHTHTSRRAGSRRCRSACLPGTCSRK
jgi:hypothetical protein